MVRILFGHFTLDLDRRQLIRGSKAIHLSPKAFELLTILVAERPRALSKAELQQRLWPATFVAEANLPNLVVEIRTALGDRARTSQFIRTVHGFGYAFSADATTVRSARELRSSRLSYWLEWGARRIPLPEGEHVVGRDRDVEVRLDASTVSRRHARITVTTEGVVLEDLGSKNGTFVAGERLTSAARLADGDLVGIGSLRLNFYARVPAATTDTQAMTSI